MMLQLSPEIIRQYSSVFIVNLSVLTTGMSVGWSSPMLVKLADPLQTPLSRPITENEASWIVSLGYLISSFSNVIGSFLLDKIGRKYSVLACAVPKLSMAIFLIFVTEVWMVIFARAFMLLNDCFLFCVVPVYAAEIASKTQRGSLGTFLQLFSSLGVVITLSVGPFVSYYTYSYILLAMVVITTIPVLILPESPFFQYSQGKTDEALKTLTEIRGSETQAKLELEDYEKSAENSIKISKVELLKNKIFLKSLLLCFLLYGGSQLVGFNAVSFYLQTILISTKTNVAPEIASVIIGVIQTMGSLSVTLLTAIFERKRILILSLSGMFIGMIGLGVFFQLSSPEFNVTGFMNYLPIISLIIVVFCYSAGFGSLIWPIGAELFEGPSRAFGTTLGLVVCQLTIFATSKYFFDMTSVLGPASTYWFFSGMCVIVGILVALFLPETKDKTFSEIQDSLGKTEKGVS
ncbi:facilitated trehalose transporter Tret1 isoform X1 [Pieris rapae]|uniref:facilitated trehalose transporter Tret1 isoform X1 n=1 Tax=Pieris rapae TaxID=64459 RepID=UPI001E27E358|nr:facilitated trehalose transporter Tret1 isoform X1 [Pieris rapae]